MSSFSYQQQHNPVYSMTKNNMSGHHDINHQNIINSSNICLFPQFYYPILSDHLDHHNSTTTSIATTFHGVPVLDVDDHQHNHNHNMSIITAKLACCDGDNDEPYSSVTKKQSTATADSSTVLESGEQVTQKVLLSVPSTTTLNHQRNYKRKTRTNGSNSAQSSKDIGRDQIIKSKGKKQKNGTVSGEKDENNKKVKVNSKKNDDESKKGQEEPPTGFIHVRARRGQATDSHSLAERVRREKISERMKMLQRLVPGCEKVTGKALMLDEIINYVQSLQNQVEFLSMKLASLNPMFYDFGLMDVDAFVARPEGLNTLASQIPSENNINYQTLVDTSASLLLQQGQRPNNAFSHDNVSLLWDMEDQRQSFSGFNNLCSFN